MNGTENRWDSEGCYFDRQSLERTYEAQRGFDMALDGQTYQPAPYIVEDTQTGFSLDGNFHCVPELEVEKRRQITRLSHHLIQSIIQEMPEPYGTVGRADTVWEILADLEDDNGLYPMEFNSLFDLFVRNYNGDVS